MMPKSELATKLDFLICVVQQLQDDVNQARAENRQLKDQIEESLFSQPAANSNRVWLDPGPAAAKLGLSGGRALHQWRKSGKLRPKTHFRNVAAPGAQVARWQYHVANCQKVLEKRI